MAYCNVTEIIKQFKLTPSQFGLEKNEENQLNALIEKWIIQATNAIDYYLDLTESYTDDEVPPLVELACTEAVGNIILNRRIRQDSTYIKSDDWTRDTSAPLDILSGVRELLDPILAEKQSYDESYIQFFAVTGKKENKE